MFVVAVYMCTDIVCGASIENYFLRIIDYLTLPDLNIQRT